MADSCPEVAKTVKETGTLDAATEEKLNEAIRKFKDKFFIRHEDRHAIS